MMDHQTIEFEETMTVSMASFERGNAKHDLAVDVRITWSPYEGIYAEALRYSYAGKPSQKLGSGITSGVMDEYVRACVAENYDAACLDRMLETDPAFEGAQLYQFAENNADRGWANSRTL